MLLNLSQKILLIFFSFSSLLIQASEHNKKYTKQDSLFSQIMSSARGLNLKIDPESVFLTLEALHVKKGKPAIISADYDGCWDILFSGIQRYIEAAGAKKHIKSLIKPLEEKIESIINSHSSIELFVGSARQSISVDCINRDLSQKEKFPFTYAKDENLCLKDYPTFAQQRGWTLNKLLLADKDNKVPPGSSWSNPSLSCKTIRNGLELKVALLQAQIDHVSSKYKEQIDFYFFDDRKDILDYLMRSHKEKKLKIPATVKFHFVQYDWFAKFEGREILVEYATL